MEAEPIRRTVPILLSVLLALTALAPAAAADPPGPVDDVLDEVPCTDGEVCDPWVKEIVDRACENVHACSLDVQGLVDDAREQVRELEETVGDYLVCPGPNPLCTPPDLGGTVEDLLHELVTAD